MISSHFRFLFLLTFVTLCMLITLPGAGARAVGLDPASSVGFVPHKALYKIDLASTKSGSQVVNINGQMFYEWIPGCDGWISNHRFKLLYEYADSSPLNITSDFSTFETYNGKSLSFTSQRKRNGQMFEELRGQAKLENGGGEAVYTIPEGLSYKLPPGTMFPMGHTLNILKKIDSGKTFYKGVVFDGSDEDGPVEINAFIGKPANALAQLKPSSDMDTALLNNRAWNVRLAFFPLNSPESMSDYEMDLVFHENGVISNMMIEYDDFSVTQTLVALEKIKSNCEKGSGKPGAEKTAQ